MNIHSVGVRYESQSFSCVCSNAGAVSLDKDSGATLSSGCLLTTKQCRSGCVGFCCYGMLSNGRSSDLRCADRVKQVPMIHHEVQWMFQVGCALAIIRQAISRLHRAACDPRMGPTTFACYILWLTDRYPGRSPDLLSVCEHRPFQSSSSFRCTAACVDWRGPWRCFQRRLSLL